MTYFAISTRAVKGRGASRRFEAEPAEPLYLQAPINAGRFSPDQSMTSGAAWASQILKTLPRDTEGRAAGDLVFLVHGYNVDEKDAFRFHDQVAKGLKGSGSGALAVSFDWPARGSFLNYLEDGRDAYQAAPHLVTSGIALFARFSEPDCRTRVHVLAHSMGALVTREAFRQAEFHPPASQRAWGLAQLILVAADISSGSLGTDLSYAMRAKAQRTTNYFSKFDAALATSNIKRFASSPRAGRHGTPDALVDTIVDVDCSDRWLKFKGPSGGVEDLALSHTWYFRDTAVFYKDLAATLAGDVDRSRLETREPVRPGADRLRLKPG